MPARRMTARSPPTFSKRRRRRAVCCIASAAAAGPPSGRVAAPWHFYISDLGHRHWVSQCRRIARHRAPDVPPSIPCCWSRPTRPFLAPVPHRGRRNEPSLRRGRRRRSGRGAEGDNRCRDRPRRGDDRQFFQAVRQGEPTRRMKITVLGCGASTGVPATRARLGPLRSRRPAQPPPPQLDPRRMPRQQAADRYLA